MCKVGRLFKGLNKLKDLWLLSFLFSSAHVGCGSHCGCGSGSYWLHGILHFQEVLQQGQEAQESPREKGRAGAQEEG